MKFYSEKDYRKELEKRGMEPYREIATPVSKPLSKDRFTPDDWAVMRAAGKCDREKRAPSQALVEAMRKRGVLNVPKEIRKQSTGGFYGS